MLTPKILFGKTLLGLAIVAGVPTAVAALGLLGAPVMQAAGAGTLAKPTKPPAPTATPVAPAQGVVYYQGPGTAGLWFINADGTGATQTDDGVAWTPSRVQHGGKRWLAQYTADPALGAYPNGQPRGEIVFYGVNANGDAVHTLTYVVPADLELNGQGAVKWLDDLNSGTADGLVSWPARRWDLNAAPPVVVQAGIYTADVLFDAATGDVAGIDGASVALAVPFALSPTGSGGLGQCYAVGGGWFADVWQLDWQPGADRVVYARCSDFALLTTDATGTAGPHTALNAAGVYPDWSVGGGQSRVVYQYDRDIMTIDPNAANPASTIVTIVAGKYRGGTTYSNIRPFWSPTGSHVVFGRDFGITGPTDLLYVAAGGGAVTLLDSLGHYPTGWVEAPAP